MSRIQKMRVGEKVILSVDYSDLKSDQMMELASETLHVILADNKPVRILNITNERNFTPPKVMRHFEDIIRQGLHLIERHSIVGLSPTKKVILKGLNLILKRDFKAFDTRDEAIAYLVAE